MADLFSIPGGKQRSGFLAGSLGTVGAPQKTKSMRMDDHDEIQFKTAAVAALKEILLTRMGAVGDEEIRPSSRRIHVNKKTNSFHIRFQQSVDGLPLEGAALIMHTSPFGQIFALNGEFVSNKNIERRMQIDCESALNVALDESAIVGGEWLSDCVQAAVLGNDGLGHKGWKRLVGFARDGQLPSRVVLFASGVNGRLLAQHPLTSGARSLQTRDCANAKVNCTVVSTSPNPISTGDDATDAAHNNAIKVLDFLLDKFERDSLDGKGMTVISQVHYDLNCK